MAEHYSQHGQATEDFVRCDPHGPWFRNLARNGHDTQSADEPGHEGKQPASDQRVNPLALVGNRFEIATCYCGVSQLLVSLRVPYMDLPRWIL